MIEKKGFCSLESQKLLNCILDNLGGDQSRVVIKNKEKTQEKLDKLIKNGSSELEIVTDFDFTMSKYLHNGQRTPSCHGIFETDPDLTEAARKKLNDLRNIYYPIEIDSNLSEQEKLPKMLEWWETGHNLIIDCGIGRQTLEKTVRECGVVLRHNVCEFLQLLNTSQIPVLVFSAGLGDVIALFLRFSNLYYDNIRIVSNFMQFDDNDKLVAFSSPIIHVFNKTTTAINSHNTKHFQNNDYNMDVQRSSVILLGDSPGDIRMASDDTFDTVLRIGFLNESVEKKLEQYQSIYDIVLIDYDTFEVPLKIVQCILDEAEKKGKEKK